jgi:hypothetical protein
MAAEYEIWEASGIGTWQVETANRIEVALEAAYIRLVEALLREFAKAFPETLDRAPCLEPESFWQPFFDFATDVYDVYAVELLELPLEFSECERLLKSDLPQHVVASITPWFESDLAGADKCMPGFWQRALIEAWRSFYHPRHRRITPEVMRIAAAMEGPASPYRGRLVESVSKHLFRRVRHWRLECKRKRPERGIQRRGPEAESEGTIQQKRRARVEEFLNKCREELGIRFTRRDIARAVGHSTTRQFSYWQAGRDRQRDEQSGATASDNRLFDRVLNLSPKQFRDLPEKKNKEISSRELKKNQL